jgi:hypothetical protein
VFENDLVGWDAAQTLAAAEANEHALITAETRRLHIAAHWADLHPGAAVIASRLPGREHPVSTSSTPAAPTHSATPSSPKQSGAWLLLMLQAIMNAVVALRTL